jgi:hypothetical protein
MLSDLTGACHPSLTFEEKGLCFNSWMTADKRQTAEDPASLRYTVAIRLRDLRLLGNDEKEGNPDFL